ncbi:hypothetical protein JTE90_012336 [Oedothorax gibbosus]|uniref:Gustatory receptor n=1 Tax=Oedothorax gibbosus TaxID=931172 RepID=A0AAV6VIZ0_9ARAC|nr:hypothetical protein JTE90_012336 [Oedothorax gibbosus]
MKFFSLQLFCPSMWKGYGLLWKFLAFTGISIIEENKTTRGSYRELMLLLPGLLFLQQIYFIYFYTRNIIQGGAAIEFDVPTIGISIVSVGLWFNVNMKKTQVRNLVLQFHRIELLKCRKKRSLNCGVNSCLAFGVFIILLVIIGHFSISPELREGDEVFSFLSTFQNKGLEFAVKFAGSVFSLFALFLMPFIWVVMCGTVYYKCSQMLEDFCQDISKWHLKREELVEHLDKYRLLRQLTYNVSNSLSSTAFLMLCWQILNMYVSLARFFSSRHVLTNTIWFNVPSLTAIPCSVVGLAMSASRVQSKQEEVRNALQNVRNNLVSKTKIGWKTLAVVDSMLKTFFPAMSAWGIVELRKELILSVFGSLFTYGLLILNIKAN